MNNTFSDRITNQVALNTAAAYGSVSNGWTGTIDLNEIVNRAMFPLMGR